METLTINIPDEKSTIVKQILKEFGVTIVSSKSKKNTLELSTEEKQEINSSREEIKKGFFVTQNELDTEINLWLKK